MNKYQFRNNDFATQIGFRFVDDKRDAQLLNDRDAYNTNIESQRFELFGKFGYFIDDNSSIALKWNIVDQSNSSIINNNSNLNLNRDLNASQQSQFFNLIYKNKNLISNDELAIGAGITRDLIQENLTETRDQEQLLNEDFIIDEFIPGGFIEYRNKDIENVNISLGLRSDFSQDHGTLITPRMHIKWDIQENLSLRASAGKGFRTPVMVTEGLSLITSTQEIRWIRPLTEEHYEETLNFGSSLESFFELFGRNLNIRLDYYRTNFLQKLIYDFEQVNINDGISTPDFSVYISDDNSYTNSFGIDLDYNITDELNINLAWKFDDSRIVVREDENSPNTFEVQRALYSPHKYFSTLSYNNTDWGLKFSLTGTYYGGGVIQNQVDFAKMENNSINFDPYFFALAQVTKEWNDIDIYAGVENLTNQTFSIYQDGVFRPDRVYGPIMGRSFYIGIRYSRF